MFCREWLAQLEQHTEQITSAGLRIAAVGLGEPKHAQRYCGSLAPSIACYANKTKEAYKAFGLDRGNLLQLMGPQVFAAGARAIARGYTQREITGDALMLGGVFVIDQEGIIRYAHYDAHAGDHPDFAEVLRAVKDWKDARNTA
ncbi:MAG: redoxin domain-containing protein [Anaerolineales bacterium]|nr:redoxin domain-containing protein [Anaerolineales bacterium]